MKIDEEKLQELGRLDAAIARAEAAEKRVAELEARAVLLEDVADKVNDAIGGLSIGASVDVVMRPVRTAMERLHEEDDDE